MVIGHAAKLFLIAAAIGLPLALISNSALGTLLYQVSPFDVSIFLVVTVVLAGVGLLASYLPAVRATHSDPMSALTHNI
jgi:ABC-type lipoprotein release transport system permease subunit